MSKLHRTIITSLAIASTLLMGCSPKIRSSLSTQRPTLAYDAEVLILNVNQELEDNAQLLGELKIGDSGFSTDCSYETVKKNLIQEARKAGANLIKVIQHKTPNAWSTCHRVKAQLYYTENLDAYPDPNDQGDTELASEDYALLHLYRYPGSGALINYNVKLGDSVIARVKNNYKATIKIVNPKQDTLAAKTETTVKLPIAFEAGKHYYVSCGISIGVVAGRPTLELIDYQLGKEQFDSLEAKNTEE